MIKLKSFLSEISQLREMVAYHGTISDFVDQIEKSGVLKSTKAGAQKVSGGYTTEGGLIWLTPDFNIASHYADGVESRNGWNLEKGLKVNYGGVVEVVIADNIKLLSRSSPLSQKEIDILNKQFIPHYKHLKLGDDFRTAEYRSNEKDISEMIKALGYDGITDGKGKQIGIATDTLPIVVIHKKPFQKSN